MRFGKFIYFLMYLRRYYRHKGAAFDEVPDFTERNGAAAYNDGLLPRHVKHYRDSSFIFLKLRGMGNTSPVR